MENSPIRLDENLITKPVEYTCVDVKIPVEYGIRPPDAFIQISVPAEHIKYWANTGNRDLYQKLINIVDKDVPSSMRIEYMPPVSKDGVIMDKVTVRFMNMTQYPFYEHILKKIADRISKLLY
jgi:hypothetical protein